MNALPATLAWCVLQVTLLAAFVAAWCLVLRRSGPATRSLAAFTGLALIVLLTFASFAPWPRWTSSSLEAFRRTGAEGRELISPPSTASHAPSTADEQIVVADASTAAAIDVQSPSPAGLFWESLVADLQAPAPPVIESRWTWPKILSAAVLVGVAVGLVRLVAGLILVRSYRVRSRSIGDSSLLELRDVLQAELNCPRPIELHESNLLATAATVGWRKPLVFLPANWREWSDDERRAVLAHEIAHIQRHDFLTWVAAQGALVLHFYHPLVHWLCGRLRLEQELAADAAAARLVGGQQTYLATLAAMALRQSDRPVAWPARTFLPTRGTFLRRIEMLRDVKLGSTTSIGVRVATIGVIVLAGLAISGLRGRAGGPAGSEAVGAAPPVEKGDAATDAGREGKRQEVARNNLKRIGLGLHNYHDVHNKFPPAVLYGYKGNGQSKYPHNWRVAILQYMSDEGIKLYDEYKFDEPWDSESNKKILAKMPPIFRDPNDPADSTNSSYFVLVGTAGTVAEPARIEAGARRAGARTEKQTTIASVFASATGTGMSEITDGTSNVLMVVEAERDIPWTKPEDIPYAADKPIPKLGGHYRGGFLTAFCDGRVEFVPDNVEEKVLRNLITMNDGHPVKVGERGGRNEQPARATARGKADPNVQMMENLKQIGLALHNYHDVFNRFPGSAGYGPADKAKYPHSWRVAILPYLNESALYNAYNFDEPWDSETNKKVLARMPAVYRDPNDPPESTNTSYFGLVGNTGKLAGGGAGATTRATKDPVSEAGEERDLEIRTVFASPKGTSMRDVTDGTSNTLMVVEAKRDIPWTKPEDIPYVADKPLPRLGGHYPGVFLALRCDGQVSAVSDKIDEKTLRALITMNDGIVAKSAPFVIPEERPSTLEGQARLNLKTIGLAVHNYHDAFGRFPATAGHGLDGKAKYPCSWRVAILPYLDHAELFNAYNFNEPWDSETNRKILAQMPAVYRDPNDPADSTNTSYFGLVGSTGKLAASDEPFGSVRALTTKDPVGQAGDELNREIRTMFASREGTRIREVTDGTSNVLTVVEAKRDIPWTKPEDLPYATDKPLPKLGGHYPGRFLILFGDGRVDFFSEKMDEKTLRRLILMNDGERVDFEKFLAR